jgi:4-amino-4-deoxy-L-arabinose transferase-like glycosyltransferase
MKPFALIALFAFLYLAGLGGPTVIDYDEGCYAEVSREMLLANQWATPVLNGEAFYEKPPLLYWTQIVGYRIFGVNAFGARFVNALAGLALVLLLYLGARRIIGESTAFRAALILGSSLFCVYYSRVAMTDMLLTLWFFLTMYCSWQAVEAAESRRGGAPWFWAGCFFAGIAMLTKGAIGGLFPAVTGFLYLLSIRKLPLLFRPSWLIPGALILCLVGFSWYLLLGLTHPDGFTFMKELFMEHHVGRFSKPMEGHSGSIFYYLPVLLVGFLPWSPFIPLALTQAGLTRHDDPRSRFLRLFAIFAGVTFCFFSIAATKLPNYITPALPGIALIAATLFDREGKTRWLSWGIPSGLSAGLLALLGLVLAVLPTLLPRLPKLLGENALKTPVLFDPPALGVTPYLSAALLLGGAVAIVLAWRQDRVSSLFRALTGAAVATTVSLFLLVLPMYDRLCTLPLVSLAQKAATLTPKDGRIVLVKLKNRPSVNFYADRHTAYSSSRNAEKLQSLFATPGNRTGITTEYYFGQLLEAGMKFQALERDSGYVLFAPENP